ncbi:MAG: hypothetical protein ABSF82_08560 [Candidatus Bathyarchaeia archaeon]
MNQKTVQMALMELVSTKPDVAGIFATQYPIPEFGPTNISLTAVVIAFVLCSIAFLRRRNVYTQTC